MKNAFVPSNLDLTIFGEKADKIAFILDRMYRKKAYSNRYGHVRKKRDITKPVTINMEYLKEKLHENPAPLMDMICYSKRHRKNGTKPIERVLIRTKPHKNGVHAAYYKLVKQYQVKPKVHRPQRTKKPVFKYDKETMEARIATWPENYQKVCQNIKLLTLEMDERQCIDLQGWVREKYIRKDRKKNLRNKVEILKRRNPNKGMIAIMRKATASWEEQKERRIAKLDSDNYDRLLFIHDKFLEMKDKDEMPVYNLDGQGRLHYYLTNMSEELRPFVRLGGCKMVSYDLGTSQPVFVWITLRDYIRANNVTLDMIKRQADEIIETIGECSDGDVPEYLLEGFEALKRKRSLQTLDDEMKQLGKMLSIDFYKDVMDTIDWQHDRKKFKTDVVFPFLYGKKPNWNPKTKGKTMMHYFLKKYPAVYCVLWRMRRFTEICQTYYQMTREKKHPLDILDHIDKTYQTSEFPKMMQRVEADMFYNTIVPQISQPFVTIHDSIVIQDGKKCDISRIIKAAFMDKYGIKVCVNREKWH